MSAPRIVGVTYWAAISPPNGRRNRWIAQWTLSRTQRGAKEKAIQHDLRPDWLEWQARGWTIERVFVSAVQMAPRE